jgi:hypothetical protein
LANSRRSDSELPPRLTLTWVSGVASIGASSSASVAPNTVATPSLEPAVALPAGATATTGSAATTATAAAGTAGATAGVTAITGDLDAGGSAAASRANA